MKESTAKKTRLCLASPLFYPTYGGSQLRFMRYLPGLGERQLDIRIFTGTPKDDDVSATDTIDSWNQYPVGAMLPEEHLGKCPINRVRLPSHNSWQRTRVFNRTLLRFCKNEIYRPDILHLVGTLRPNSIPWLYQLRALGIPVIYSVTIASKLIYKRSIFDLRRWRFRMLFDRLDCVVTNSTLLRDLMRDMGVSTRIEVIQNGINLKKFHPVLNKTEDNTVRSKLGICDNDIMITTVGAVIPRKGGDLLLDAWLELNKKIKNTHLVFVGPRKNHDDPGLIKFHKRIEELIKKSGSPECIHFVGMTEDVHSYLQASDIFVLPSQCEGMPNSVIEAMATEKPVIITPFTGLSDDLGKAGEQYLLVDANRDALTDGLKQLILDQGMRQTLAAQGRLWIEKTMDVGRSLDQYAVLYHELAKNK